MLGHRLACTQEQGPGVRVPCEVGDREENDPAANGKQSQVGKGGNVPVSQEREAPEGGGQ